MAAKKGKIPNQFINAPSRAGSPLLPFLFPICRHALCQSPINAPQLKTHFPLLSGSILQPPVRQEINELPCPLNVESRTIRRYPVFLRARLEGFPRHELFFALTRFPIFNHKPR